VRCGKGLTVLLHLGSAEQLRSKGRLIAETLALWNVIVKPHPQLAQTSDNGRIEGRQVKNLLVEKLSIN
jgi:hypothetical protein